MPAPTSLAQHALSPTLELRDLIDLTQQAYSCTRKDIHSRNSRSPLSHSHNPRKPYTRAGRQPAGIREAESYLLLLALSPSLLMHATLDVASWMATMAIGSGIFSGDSRKDGRPSVQLSALLAVLVEELAWMSDVFARSDIRSSCCQCYALFTLKRRRRVLQTLRVVAVLFYSCASGAGLRGPRRLQRDVCTSCVSR